MSSLILTYGEDASKIVLYRHESGGIAPAPNTSLALKVVSDWKYRAAPRPLLPATRPPPPAPRRPFADLAKRVAEWTGPARPLPRPRPPPPPPPSRAQHFVADMERVHRGAAGVLWREAVGAVHIKWADDARQLRALAHEARFYANELAGLQGTVVPICYGLYTASSGKSGPDIGCLVMEHCLGTGPRKRAEYSRQAMVQTCLLHQTGVLHRQLAYSQHIIQQKGGLRIVDFSQAEAHNCVSTYPKMPGMPEGCPELQEVEKIMGDIANPQEYRRR